MVWWLAPPMFDDKGSQEILEKYLIIAVLDMRTDAAGTVTFDMGDVQVQDGSGKTMKALADADEPPGVIGVTTALRSMLSQTLGQVGKGMHLFIYEAGSVHACSQGRLSVTYEDETYTYDTPIPGCSAN